jgi:hypothetical protein
MGVKGGFLPHKIFDGYYLSTPLVIITFGSSEMDF